MVAEVLLVPCGGRKNRPVLAFYVVIFHLYKDRVLYSLSVDIFRYSHTIAYALRMHILKSVCKIKKNTLLYAQLSTPPLDYRALETYK